MLPIECPAHGFRATAQRPHPAQVPGRNSRWTASGLSLAHRPRGVRALYNHTCVLGWNVAELAQWFANHLDGLRDRGEVMTMPKRFGASRERIPSRSITQGTDERIASVTAREPVAPARSTRTLACCSHLRRQ